MKKWKLLLAATILSIILTINFVRNINNEFSGFDSNMRQAFLNLKEKEFIGKVVAVKIDSANHHFKTILFNDSSGKTRSFILEFDKGNLFNNVSKGDSIIKHCGSYEVRVVAPNRKDTVFILDYGINDLGNASN